MDIYTFKYKNVERHLPVYAVNSGLNIAYLDTLSDVELVNVLSREMVKLVCENEKVVQSEKIVILTAANKGIPFAYGVANGLIEKYQNKKIELAVARKVYKKFFGKCVSVSKTSITSLNASDELILTESDAKKLENSCVLLVDDMYSTGASVTALQALAEKCGANVIDRVVAVAEISGEDNVPEIKHVATLPLIK